MGRPQPNIYHFLSRYFTDKQGLGMQPVIVLDTSAIISLEQGSRRQYGYNKAHEFIDELNSSAANGIKFIVPDEIKKETAEHAKMRINGNYEVSGPTLARIVGFEDDVDLDSFVAKEVERIDTARYFLRQMYEAEMKGKKKDLDPISRNDWAVIDKAIAAGIYSEHIFEQNNSNSQEGCYQIAVLSGDQHIIKTINSVLDHPEGVGLTNFLRAVDTNHYQYSFKRE